MKILIIGGEGTIGRRVTAYFKQKNQVIVAGRSSGSRHVAIGSNESLEVLFQKTGKLDAIICTAGEAKWAPFRELTEEDYYIGIKSKLMGQVNIVR